MLALGRRSRTVLAALSLASFGGAFALMPLGARGAAGDGPAAVVLATPAPPVQREAAVVPSRDPFAGPDPAKSAAPSSTIAALPTVPGALPPNLGAQGGPLPAPPPLARVTAIATGAHPSALVEEAGNVRLIGLGDKLAGASVDAIDAAGVHLSDHTTLGLDSAPARAAPAPLPSRVPPSPPPAFVPPSPPPPRPTGVPT
ncbi:MAG: hypothetical protein JO225_13515 [Candidatus Eremiobacteraeota bacterium]|nr:hypothetical protein [Candidatus Eremiobacteraeota bacterium]